MNLDFKSSGQRNLHMKAPGQAASGVQMLSLFDLDLYSFYIFKGMEIGRGELVTALKRIQLSDKNRLSFQPNLW